MSDAAPVILNCIQGSAEWEQARLGIPTASRFADIVTPGLKLSGSRTRYMQELLAEWALGRRVDEFKGSHWTERGHELEGEASDFYAVQRDIDPVAVGFVYRDEDRAVGASPDWLCGDDGIAECKAPAPPTHVGYLLANGIPGKYRIQTQGQLWVTQKKWLDFISYCPGMPPVLVRSFPDKKTQEVLSKHIPAFVAEMLEARDKLRARGVVSPMDGGEER